MPSWSFECIKTTVWCSVQSYQLAPPFRRNTTTPHTETPGKVFHRNVGINRQTTRRRNLENLNTHFCENLNSYTVLSSHKMSPETEVKFPWPQSSVAKVHLAQRRFVTQMGLASAFKQALVVCCGLDKVAEEKRCVGPSEGTRYTYFTRQI